MTTRKLYPMIKTIPNFLNKQELELTQQYWALREPLLQPCEQCPNAVSTYSDFLSETFLVNKKDLVEKTVGEPLLSTYSFSRMYYSDSILAKHSDRPSCEVSITLNIEADKEWPLWFVKLDEKRKPMKVEPCSLITKPGDAAVYEGCAYEHWRDPYDGKKCMQVFLHYVKANGRYTSFAKDGRKHFGQMKEDALKRVWNP
jgi:hypothetical protein